MSARAGETTLAWCRRRASELHEDSIRESTPEEARELGAKASVFAAVAKRLEAETAKHDESVRACFAGGRPAFEGESE